MGTRVFSFDIVRPQISTFHRQPEPHHASFSGRRSFFKLRPSLQLQKLAIKCGGDQLEVKRKDEMKREDNCDGILMEEQDDIISKEEDVNEKVELMEIEAIMGKDDGKEPMDYKRRAGIFYKSSEMFQANKDPPPHQHHHCTQK